MELQCLLTCDHCLLTYYWEPLKKGCCTLLHSTPHQCVFTYHSSFMYHSSYERYSSISIVFVALHWTSSSMSMCLLYSGAQQPTHDSGMSTRNEWRRITLLDLQAMHLLMQHRMSSFPQDPVAGSWSTWCSPEPPCASLQSCFPAGQLPTCARVWSYCSPGTGL